MNLRLYQKKRTKLKNGEFVRTKKGSIDKLKFYGIYTELVYFENNKGMTCVTKNEIANHSFDIIDLIEEGDYVNGKRVIYVASIENKDDEEELCVFVEETQDCIEAKDIKSIVTKEQFESMKYVVGG